MPLRVISIVFQESASSLSDSLIFFAGRACSQLPMRIIPKHWAVHRIPKPVLWFRSFATFKFYKVWFYQVQLLSFVSIFPKSGFTPLPPPYFCELRVVDFPGLCVASLAVRYFNLLGILSSFGFDHSMAKDCSIKLRSRLPCPQSYPGPE